jgi:hypothetical protein
MRDLTPLTYDVRPASVEQTEEIRQWEEAVFKPFLAMTRTAALFYSLDDEQIAKYGRDVMGKQFNVRAGVLVVMFPVSFFVLFAAC